MSYRTGTIAADITDPSQHLMVFLSEELEAHPSWEYIDTIVMSDGPVEDHYIIGIYKNLGSLNDFGRDFYLGIMRKTEGVNANPLNFMLSELYDTTSQRAANVVPDSQYRCFPTVEDGSCPQGDFRDFDNGYADNGYTMRAVIPTALGVAFDYHIKVTKNALMLSTTVASVDPDRSAVYLGLFRSSFPDHPKEFPLCISDFLGNYQGDSITNGFSRLPGGPTNQDTTFGLSSGRDFDMVFGRIGQPNQLLGFDATGSRIMLQANNYGEVRGYLYDSLRFADPYSGVVVGDTIVVDGNVHVNIIGDGAKSVYIDTEVAY